MMFPSSLGSTLDNPVGEFGDKFREAREKKELSYDDVSNVTKISSRMLQAIEEEHFDQLPGGVFNKGFIRAYAKHLGLNPEDAVTDYLACLRQAQIDAHEVWDPQPPAPSRVAPPTRAEKPHVEPVKPVAKAESPAGPEELPGLQLPRAEHIRAGRKDLFKSPREIPWSIIAVSAVVVVLALILWIRHTRPTNAGTSSPATVQANAAEVKPGPAENKIATVNRASDESATDKSANDKIVNDKIAKEKIAPEKSATTAPAALPASTTANPSTLAHSSPTNPPPNPTQAASAPPAKSAIAANPGGTSAIDNNDVTVRTFAKSNRKPADKSAAPLTLTIRATETSWISVLSDGQPASQETLIAPAHTSVRAAHEIVAKVGNAAGVTFLWNGREISAEGAESEVKTFIFDAQGMRVLPTTTPSSPNQ
jgi:cytoskeletal protein RodZ